MARYAKYFVNNLIYDSACQKRYDGQQRGAVNDNQQNNPNDTDGDQQTTPSTHAPKWKIATTTGDLKGHSGYETEEKAIRGLYEAGFRYIDFSMYSFTQSCGSYYYAASLYRR